MKIKLTIRKTIALACTAALMTFTVHSAETSELFAKNCASCHGKDGKGQTRMGKKLDVKDYTDPKVQSELKDEVAIKTIKEGLKDANGKEKMKAYGETLSDADIKGLVAYFRAFKP